MEKHLLDPNVCGTVKWFHGHKAFGFITLDDGREAFVHITGFRDQEAKITGGERVTARLYKSERGLFCRGVEVMK